MNKIYLVALLVLLFVPTLFAGNNNDISVDFDLIKTLETYEVMVSIKNESDRELSLLHPDFRHAIAFVVFDGYGNPLMPSGIAKVDPNIQKFLLKPNEIIQHAMHKSIETTLVFPFLTGTALFGYELEQGKTYRIIAIYRPYGKKHDGVCSKEKIIKFK